MVCKLYHNRLLKIIQMYSCPGLSGLAVYMEEGNVQQLSFHFTLPSGCVPFYLWSLCIVSTEVGRPLGLVKSGRRDTLAFVLVPSENDSTFWQESGMMEKQCW